MNKKARVLITRKCHRKCPGCCSDNSSAMQDMKTTDMQGLLDYDSITITGGEPMLFPNIVKDIVLHSPDQRVYIYTTLGTKSLAKYIGDNYFAGITYTLHIPITSKDIRQFARIQNTLETVEGSWRLNLDPNITIDQLRDFKIDFNVWTSVKVLNWIDSGDCPIGEGEDLLYLS